MKGEGERHNRLRQEFQRHRPRRKARGDDGALEVQADVGCDEVGGTEKVEGSAHCYAGQAVEHREIPCDLGLVDAEVGRDGAVLALFGEDLFRRRFLGDGLRGGQSAVCG